MRHPSTGLTDGTKVTVNKHHHGMRGCTGTVKGNPEKLGGHWYYSIRITGGRQDCKGQKHRFTARELDSK